MTEILNDRNYRVIAVIGMYLLYELANKVIDSNYNFKATYNDKSIVLQKEPIITLEINHSTTEQNT